ncbi:transcription/translation regulatory transformer protein RfaH [Rahnella sp. AA]|uniref:transcription/translation regulatory transformer protein RfaH n=1 Tax=Rahnella sp. AA TaxID=2057180 RepID=UPI000C32A5D6|nr:transcription/translation regulatory transformer protein RfaH [Rahnella sp. AA]PKE27618.1 transcription/translation regulatory transformer protein RfaH [Rahnella sp. AA]
MEHWYVAQTQYAQEKRAQQHLGNQGVTCFLPLYTAQVLSSGQIKAVTPQALFPGYLFVRFDPEIIHTTTIKSTRGVSSLISFGGLPSAVPDAVVERLKSHDCLSPAPDAPVHGDRVEVLSGVFEGLEAVWLEPDGTKRAMLMLTLMNQEMRVPVSGRRAPDTIRVRVLGRGAAA